MVASPHTLAIQVLPAVVRLLAKRPKFKYPLFINEVAASQVLSVLPKEDFTGKCIVDFSAGAGALTSRLLDFNPRRIIAVERSDKLISILSSLSEKHPNVSVVENDFMESRFYARLEMPELLGSEIKIPWTDESQVTAIGALSYKFGDLNLTHLVRWLSDKAGLHAYGRVPLYLFVNKEVTKRVFAQTGEQTRSRIPVIVNTYTHAEKLLDAVPNSHYPYSAELDLLRLRPRITPLTDVPIEDLEFVLRNIFCARAAKIRNAVKGLSPSHAVLLARIPLELLDKEVQHCTDEELGQIALAFSTWDQKPVVIQDDFWSYK